MRIAEKGDIFFHSIVLHESKKNVKYKKRKKKLSWKKSPCSVLIALNELEIDLLSKKAHFGGAKVDNKT